MRVSVQMLPSAYCQTYSKYILRYETLFVGTFPCSGYSEGKKSFLPLTIPPAPPVNSIREEEEEEEDGK